MKLKHLALYCKERFPPVNMMLFAILFLTVYSVAQYLSPTFESKGTIHMAVGIIAVISFFFRLRVFDEIKDYKIDEVNHPQRVLQSGRVTLKQLMLIAAIISIAEISWSIYSGWPAFICWCLALLYSVLMRYEFFIGHFLKKRLFLYAFTHMLVMPLIILWIWSAYSKSDLQNISLSLLALLSVLGGFSFEIARKIHAPDAERKTVDSYSKSLGYLKAVVFVWILLLAGIGAQFYLLSLLSAGILSYLLLGILYLATIAIYAAMLTKPVEKNLRKAEIFVSLFMLVSYLSIIFEIQSK